MLAEEANLGKTRFLAAAGHDILQPLNAARLYCASLIEKARKGEPARRRGQHRIVAGIGRDHPRRRARHFAARRRRHEAGGDGVPAGRAAAPDRHRLPADGGGKAAGAHHRAVVADGAAPTATCLRRLIQNLVSNAIKYTRARPHPGRRAPARRARRDPGVRHRHRHPGRQAEHGVPRVHPARGGRARGARGSGSACRSSTASRACCGWSCRSIPAAARARASRSSCRSTEAEEPALPEKARLPLQPGAALAGMSVLCIDNDARILEGMRLLLEGWGCSVATHAGSRDRL